MEIIISFFFWDCDVKQWKSKLVAKYEIKCLDFQFIHGFFWCCDSLRVSFVLQQLHLGCWYNSLSHVAFGLPAGFFLPVGLFQDFDFFPLYSSNRYLVTRGFQFQIPWSTINQAFIRINQQQFLQFLLHGTILLNSSVNIMRIFVN